MLPKNTSDLLPQKFPFQMVDTLLEVNETEIKTSFLIHKENVLVVDGFFSEGGLLENMAQSAAAGTGYLFTSQGKNVPLGYIGAIKHISILTCPAVGTQIETEIITRNKIGNASIVEGKIFYKKEVIASCELTIFVSD